jgi:hypothetical protein
MKIAVTAAAAQEMANYETASLRADIKVLQWMVGFNLAMTLAILWHVFARG